MTPKLSILPLAQQKLWPQLVSIPERFILYGGTAVALQLGHRESVDFDFFSLEPLDRQQLVSSVPLLQTCQIIQPEINTLNCFLSFPEGEVKLQFLAGLKGRQGQMFPALKSIDNGLQIATLADLAATKMNTIQSRAQVKDYLDIAAMLKNGLALSDCLGYAKAIYGVNFDPASSLKALCSYRDGDLMELPTEIKQYLIAATKGVRNVPRFTPFLAPAHF